ncbi:X-Pro dipeptidyl-peptidase [Pedobacter cryoconitis]|uniref:X-Pro dipeptidyl-peptidase n=1 Tax=Pedobacter cryoconitis TaxID=188932 RepID=A0A127VCW2_9SPHI|nr:CocE/NonD family hydrolase [Pedobacter cryoconitis]AMP99186.1 X-Pro dipeptidyl-peptidase [Pedobacter cryoconitis]
MKSLATKTYILSAAVSMLSFGTMAQRPAQNQDNAIYITTHYTKIEKLVPMRDGVKLFTIIYVPKDNSKEYPILYNRTPYSAGPYGAELYKTSLGPSMVFAKDGYIFVYQDVRGRYMSEGEFVANRPFIPDKKTKTTVDESSDSYDTIDWLVKNVKGNNGKVGTWGISAPGFYTTMTTIDAHPALKAASPQAPVTDWFLGDDRHHNGAFFLMGTFSFLAYYGTPRPEPTPNHADRFTAYGTPDAYEFYKNLGPLKNADERYFKGKNLVWNEMMDNENYNDFWKSRTPVPHLKNIKPAVMTVGGWFDQEDLYGPLKTFAGIEQNKPAAPNYLVMGPWTHGSWTTGSNASLGNVRFNSETGPYYREQIELTFFNHYLKGTANPELPKATIFETGSNQWKKYAAWPPAEAKEERLYFHASGKLSFEAPLKEAKEYDEFISDPENPVPYTNEIRIDRGSDYMYEDQRFAAKRPDVLVYQTPILENDVVISGHLLADLFVSTTGTDADFVVKLIDVYPGDAPDDSPLPGTKMGGFQQLVRGEVMRSKFRNSFSAPEAMVPGAVTEVKFDMQDAAHCFKKGHKIMVQVQSSWFPLVDRNPQTFVNVYKATETDFQKATHRVYFKTGQASSLKVSVLKAD